MTQDQCEKLVEDFMAIILCYLGKSYFFNLWIFFARSTVYDISMGNFSHKKIVRTIVLKIIYTIANKYNGKINRIKIFYCLPILFSLISGCASNQEEIIGINFNDKFNTSKKWIGLDHERLVDEMYSAGFNAVRIPIKVSDKIKNKDEKIKFFNSLDDFSKKLIEKNFLVVIDLHDDYYSNPPVMSDHSDLLLAWGEIISVFKKYNENLVYEILNEPHGINIKNNWNNIQESVIEKIRKEDSNKKRKIIVTPHGWSDILSYKNFKKINQENLIYTFHYYEPFIFTHQGAYWTKNYYPVGAIWQDAASELKIVRDFLLMNAISPSSNIVLGEFGVIKLAKDDVSKHKWINVVKREAKRNGYWSFYWSMNGDFGIYDEKNFCWDKNVLLGLTGGGYAKFCK